MEVVRLNELGKLYRESYLELMDYCFNPDTRDYFEKEFDEITPDKGVILGMLEGESLASTVTVIQKEMTLNHEIVKMGGIACVASSAYHRSGGMVSQLMKESLRWMVEQNIVFSLLAPFKYEFYEKFGWKLCLESLETKFSIQNLKSFQNKGRYHPLQEGNLIDINDFYHRVISGYNGSCVRTLRDFKKKFDAKNHGRGVIYQNNEGQLEGYLFYKLSPEESKLTINELLFTTPDALASLLQFVYLHEAQVKEVVIWNYAKDLLMHRLKNPSAEWSLNPGMMGRIVQVEQALKSYSFIGSGNFVIKVNDALCEWNHQTFELEVQDGKVQSIKISKSTPQLEIDIKELSQLVMGYRHLFDLIELGEVKIFDEKVLKYFPNQIAKCALYDFF